MAATFEPARLARELDGILRGLPRPARGLAIALSGGLDSTVLATALAGLSDARQWPPLRALHVDHGLHPDSRSWAEACVRTCDGIGITCAVVSVDVRAARGASPEASARAARYAAIAAQLASDEVLLTAHHADDQLETVLIQLLRGGGLRGVAGMPRIAPLGAGWQARPLLGVRRAALETWARLQGLRWSEDPSNLDRRYDRNYLRHEILPRLETRWPDASLTVARVAALCAEAADLTEAVAAADLDALREGVTLPLAGLAPLAEPRRRAVLRAWLSTCDLPLPSPRTLAALQRDADRAAVDRIPCTRWPGARVHRYRGRLYADRPGDDALAAREWPIEQPLDLDALGCLTLSASTGRGLARARTPARLELRPRVGGERFIPAGGTQHRPLRKWLQEQGVLPWQRDRIPLLYADDELVAIAGLGYGATLAAAPGEPSWEIEWTRRAVLTEVEALRAVSP